MTRMSLAEVAAAGVTAFLAAMPMVAYLMDAVGLGVMPAAVLFASLAIAAAVAVSLARQGRPGWSDLIGWSGVVCLVTAWLLRITWPSLLPPGRGSDLTHHLLLVDYIEQEPTAISHMTPHASQDSAKRVHGKHLVDAVVKVH